jgi:hypothetical protein
VVEYLSRTVGDELVLSLRCRGCQAEFVAVTQEALVRTPVYRTHLEAQGGGCALCGQKPQRKAPLLVDVEPYTDRLRGLLCWVCSATVGLLEDPNYRARAFEHVGIAS